MALHNEILSGRFNRFLQKVFQIKGRPPAPQLASEIVVGMQLFSGAEHRPVEGWLRFGIGRLIAAQGVGVSAGGRLFNHAGTGVIAVIEKLVVTSPVADTLTLEYLTGAATADLATTARGLSMEKRQSNPSSNSIWSEGNGNAGGGGVNIIDQITLGVNSRQEVIFTDLHEISLPPGAALAVRAQVANNSLTITMWWRERGLEESELT